MKNENFLDVIAEELTNTILKINLEQTLNYDDRHDAVLALFFHIYLMLTAMNKLVGIDIFPIEKLFIIVVDKLREKSYIDDDDYEYLFKILKYSDLIREIHEYELKIENILENKSGGNNE